MVYIKSLEKEIFPYYLPPEKDELFTSWFCRLSNNHDVKTNTFIQNYFGRNVPFWNRDIDVLEPENIINIMVKHTPLRIENIHEMFLRNYEGFAYYKYHHDGTIRNILPLGINHRKRKQFGQQCCTKCLSMGTVYFKKSWRLITSVVCTECNQLLIDRCYKCGSPITYYRVNMKSFSNLSTMEFQPLFLCSNCNTDLRKYEPNRIPTKLELDYQKYIDNSILTVFPNPATESVNIMLTGSSINDYKIVVVDVTGRKIKSLNNLSEKQCTINITDLLSGFYFIEINDNNGKTLAKQKLIVQ